MLDDGATRREVASQHGHAAGRFDRILRRPDHRLAGHLAEMASLAAPQATEVRQARAQVFGERAKLERSTMAKGVFAWASKESTD